jgi:hypothetical protein
MNGERSMKKDDSSKFIERMRAEVFHRKIEHIKARNAGTDPDRLQEEVDDAVRSVRERKASRSGR